MKKLLLAGALILAFISCNNDAERPDSPAIVPVDTAVVKDNPVFTNDTATKVVKEAVIPKKTAGLGYSYYPKMKRNETKIMRAYVAINNPESKIRDTLRQIEKIQTVETFDADTSTINVIKNILFYKKIKIAIDSTSDFSIKAIRPDQQEIDTLNGNLWLWQITAKTDKKTADLTILVDAATPEGALENIDIRDIKIQIDIDKVTFIRAIINYLGDNPKVSIPLAAGFIGFIGWLIKFLLEKKKKDK